MLKDKEIFSRSPDELTPEQRELLKLKIVESVQRIRKARGEVAEADIKKAEEKAAKKPRKSRNLDLDTPS